MLYDQKTLKNLFENLKSFSDNKEKYISKIIDDATVILIDKTKEENDKIDKDKIKILMKHEKNVIKDLYEDYINRCGNDKNITEDIEYVGSGHTSIAFRVGDNIIKFGKSNSEIKPNQLDSKYQVPIYSRESHRIGEKSYLSVEIAPYVDTKNITKEDVAEAYKNIRKLGYIWNDPKEENIGRIINVNGCTIDNKKYLPKHKYNKGDLVVIDLEDIAYVGEVTSDEVLEEIAMTSYNKDVFRLETKYMEEYMARKAKAAEKTTFDDGTER